MESGSGNGDVLDDMSFRKEESNGNKGGERSSKSSKKKKKKKKGKVGSAAPAPVIVNSFHNDDRTEVYGEEIENSAGGVHERTMLIPTGDPNINPNTGVANKSRDYNMCNPPPPSRVDLPVVVFRMRVLNMICCTAAISMETTSLILKIFRPAELVLGSYLGVFACILCCYELHTPKISDIIADNFGFLSQPLGRAFFLLLMSSLAIGQGGLLMLILGIILFANALFSIYLPCKYPQFKDVYEHYAMEDAVAAASQKATTYAWANPGTVSSMFSNSQ
uniref:Uncharacterized protein n=1 Tax=Helicotheca tamesis TaxID=374047 RepID=A0A7S2MBL5_9STRA|mmetsp:Transcript_13015/g.17908  ORF Transcript_13015/g.17908 Transcript_13015/m.17908 type:complete len:277 (+) Transcript_13015:48-878(+)